MEIYHNSRDITYRNPTGAVPAGTTVKLCIDAPHAISVALRIWDNHQEYLYFMEKHDDRFSHDYLVPDCALPIWYMFIVNTLDGTLYYGNNGPQYGGAGEVCDYMPASFQITVYDPAYAAPEWMASSVFYQIMTDRFHNGNARRTINPKPNAADIVLHKNIDEPVGMERDEDGVLKKNDFYGGNLKGITAKLPYLKALGINALYLNPIFEAYSNHKYDTADYTKIDPMFGNEDDLVELCAKAKESGIHIILDGVFSHTGADSIYFNKYGRYDSIGAYQSYESPYREWYTFKQSPDEYACWWGCTNLPEVKEETPSYQDFIMDVIRKWQGCGISGWRLDVADELPQGFLRTLRRTVKAEMSDALVLGEVWEDASRKITYGELRNYFYGETLDGVMNYPMRDAILEFVMDQRSCVDTVGSISSIIENYPPYALAASLLSLVTHDTPRLLNIVGREDLALLAITLQFTLPSAPCIYYGEEVGLMGEGDPLNRAPHPWNVLNVNINRHYQRMTELRTTYPALDGLAEAALSVEKADTLLLRRSVPEQDIYVIAHRGKRPSATVKLQVRKNETFEVLVQSPGSDASQRARTLSAKVPARGFIVIAVNR